MQQSITYIPNNTGMMTMSKKPEHLIWELSFENRAVLIVWYHSIATGLLLFSCQAMFDSLWPLGLQHTRLPCPSLFPRVCPNSCPLNHWCHPTISSSATLFSSCPQSFPASGSLPMSWLFASGGQRIGASTSASVLLMSIQGWFPLRLTSLMPLLFKGLSRIFSKHHNSKTSILWHTAFFTVQLSHPYMTNRKTIALTIRTLSAKRCLCFLTRCLGLS